MAQAYTMGEFTMRHPALRFISAPRTDTTKQQSSGKNGTFFLRETAYQDCSRSTAKVLLVREDLQGSTCIHSNTNLWVLDVVLEPFWQKI